MFNPTLAHRFFYWKSQRFDKNVETFGCEFFFIQIFKIHRLVWMFLWIFGICSINILFKFITNFKFDKCCFIKDYLWKHI
jgi:hypothetical protein